jgi:predicted nucleotidyltransferase
MKTDVNKLFEELACLSQVEAIALGGSRATGRNDEKSDYDVYVYLNSAIDEAIRRSILEKYCSYMEIGNSFWELEDEKVEIFHFTSGAGFCRTPRLRLGCGT